MGKKRKSGLILPEDTSVLDTPDATLALFAYADVKPDTVDCLLRDLRLWPNIVYYRVSNDALISRSRSRAASDFLRAKRENVGDVLLMLDHDMKWAEGDLVYLAEKTLEAEGVVAGIYSKRDFGGGVAVRFATHGKFNIGEDVLAPAQYVSTGFIGIHRKVLEKMAETMPLTIGNFWPFFLPIVADHGIDEDACEYLSEDWAFCARVHALEFPVYAALKPRLVHVGEWAYRLIDSQASAPPDRNISFTIAKDVEIPAVQTLMKDVADYTDIPPDQVHKAIKLGREGLAGLWHNEGGFDPRVEAAWYRRADVGKHQLLDLAGWHFSTIAPLLPEGLGDVKGSRVLDFGSGIGTMALMLTMQENEVDCVEVSPELKKFARYRNEKHLNGVAHPRFVDKPDGTYDVVVFWHVAEHLPDPAATLDTLVAALKPGGRMFTDWDFHQDALHPMHHEIDGKWEEQMVKAGLRPTDRAYWWEKV
jgi:hypothetical protein